MTLKQRVIVVSIMASTIALIMTCAMVLLNKGYTETFYFDWLKSYIVAFPMAWVIAFFVSPVAHKVAMKYK